MNNTYPNPDLYNPNAPGGYDPAHMLRDESHERCGRETTTKLWSEKGLEGNTVLRLETAEMAWWLDPSHMQ